MKIEQALALTQQDVNRVCFIKDNRLFYKLYNQSVYITTVLLNAQFKVYTRTIKKLNNETLIISGFPIHSLSKFFPDAEPTEWGFVLPGNFDLSGYCDWVEKVLQSNQQVVVNRQPTNPIVSHSPLTPQQLCLFS